MEDEIKTISTSAQYAQAARPQLGHFFISIICLKSGVPKLQIANKNEVNFYSDKVDGALSMGILTSCLTQSEWDLVQLFIKDWCNIILGLFNI